MKVARMKDNVLEREISRRIGKLVIEECVVESGLVERRRKVDPVLFIQTLLLSSFAHIRSLKSLQLRYIEVSGATLGYSSFYDRFTPSLLALLRNLKGKLTRQLPQSPMESRFAPILVIDSSVFPLVKKLITRFESVSDELSSAKLHLVYSVDTATVQQVKITSGRRSDIRAFKRLGSWVKGKILLMDKGYQDYGLWRRIHNQKGFFLTPLKKSANIELLGGWEGIEWKDFISKIRDEVFDVEVSLAHKARKYRGNRSKKAYQCRVIGMRKEDGSYWLYATNLSNEQLAAEDAYQLYRLRWQVELFFKALKQYGSLMCIKSRKDVVLKILLELTFIAALLAASLRLELLLRIPSYSSTPLKFFQALSSLALRILDLLSPAQHTWHSVFRHLILSSSSHDPLHPINTDFLLPIH